MSFFWTLSPFLTLTLSSTQTDVYFLLYSKMATSYTAEEWQRDLINKITSFIQSNISFIGVSFLDPSAAFEKKSEPQKSVRVLDYACGPGTITAILAGRATEFVGVDLSENMVQAYNSRFTSEKGGETADDEKINAHAVVGNLISTGAEADALDGPNFRDFDLAVVGMGFHHFTDIRLATRRLVERLKPGGVFMIVDFVTHAMEAEVHPDLKDAVNTISHHGFGEEELRKVFAEAGLTDFALVRMGEEVTLRGTSKREPFMARGTKI